jgi:methionyl aminopeptidase
VIVLKTPKEIEQQRIACRIVAEILLRIKQEVKPGITLIELDAMAEKLTKQKKAVPAFKGVIAKRNFEPFPSVICASVNEEVIHGIPSKRVLKNGDIVSIDFGVKYDGFYGDAAITVPVGNISENAKKLLDTAKESLNEAIKKAVEGGRLSDISNAIQTHVEGRGFSVVREFVGHGIGRDLHEEPQIPNFGISGSGIRLKPGMVLAIEPMINEGTYDVNILSDGWTAVTADGKLSAHFEHCVAITNNEPIVLTKI